MRVIISCLSHQLVVFPKTWRRPMICSGQVSRDPVRNALITCLCLAYLRQVGEGCGLSVRRAAAASGVVLAAASCAMVAAVLLAGREQRGELKSFDWETVPKDRPLSEDWVGDMGVDGHVRPATCKKICEYCFQGALEGWTYPGGSMAGDACGLCNCEKASAPEFDTWTNEGRCSPDLCFACEMGKVTGKPCQSCECGEWRDKRSLEDVCPNRKQVCYSCMSGTLQGFSCNKCQCGHWEDWNRKSTEERFGAHDCTTVCHHCNIGAIVDPRCDMCFCEQSLDPSQQQPVTWHKRGDLEGVVESYKGTVGKESSTYKHVQGALDGYEGDRGYRTFPEGVVGDELPHYDWMNDEGDGSAGWGADEPAELASKQ